MFKFYRVPKDCSDMHEVMIRFCLDRHRDLDDNTSICIQQICKECGYSSKSRSIKRFPLVVKEKLSDLLKQGVIEQTFGKSPNLSDFGNMMSFHLSDDFSPCEGYILLPIIAFETISSYKWQMSKTIPLQLYLYMRSYIYDNNKDDKPYGFFQDLRITAEVTGISRKRIDKCLQVFIDKGLFVKVEVGSHKNNNNIANAPNLYLLPDENIEKNERELIKMMKEKYNVEEFMDITSVGNKLRKD